MLKAAYLVQGSGLGLGLRVQNFSITEKVRFSVSCDGESKMVDQGYIEARVTSMFQGECMIEFEVKAEIWVKSKMKVKCQILAQGLGLALVVRDFSITEKVRFSVSCDGESKMVDQGYIEARVSSMFQGEYMIEFEDKAEIWLTSKMKVKCQILAPGLGLALVVRDISITERVRFVV
ncbi:Stomatin-Like Protein 2 [Manis pentadactyla]|nr:Stomatin-Like Protein 2 [Manis pentadactyla]